MSSNHDIEDNNDDDDDNDDDCGDFGDIVCDGDVSLMRSKVKHLLVISLIVL